MKTKNIGRVVGGLLLVQLVGLMAGFILLMPGVTSDYLTAAAGMEGTIRLAVILLFASAAIAVAMAVAAFPVFSENSRGTALWIFAMAAAWFVLQSVDNAHILSMMSISKRFAADAGGNADLYNVLGVQVRSTRVWAHYTTLLVIDVWLALFYGALFAFRLVPRIVAGIGLLAVALHLIGVPLPMFVGYPSILPLAYGLGVSYLIVGGWLTVKGMEN